MNIDYSKFIFKCNNDDCVDNEEELCCVSCDLFDKCLAFDDAKRVQAAGVYPFFRPIEASSGSSVVTHGKKRVMIGSNNYLGLTHHPRVQAAAKKAIDSLGTGCTGSRFLNGNLGQLHIECGRSILALG